jgi:predicted lipoprotein with Yx(FWY)xxD motif
MTNPDPMRRLSLLAGIGVAAILAAACTSGATTAPSVPAAASPSASASASAAASPSASAEESASGEAYEVTIATDAKLGKILTGEDGKTLYKFAADSPGKSTCSGGCADNWPPFALEGSETVKAGDGVTGKLGTITRDDGKKQVTYNDVPLYYFAGDSKAGDTNGQGIAGKWSVVNP